MTGTSVVSDLASVALLLFLACPLVVAMYMFWLAWTRGGQPAPDAIAVQYEPPDNLTPAECAGLVDNAVPLCGITATITDLSVRGYLTIEPKQAGASPGEAADYIFHRAKPLTDLAALKPHEREVFTSIFVPTNPMRLLTQSLTQLANAAQAAGHQALSSFTSGVGAEAKEVDDRYSAFSGFSDSARDSVRMSDLQVHFPLHLAKIRDAVFDELMAAGYYTARPDRIRKNYMAQGILLGIVMAAAGGALTIWIKIAPLWLILVGLFSGAIVLGFGYYLPARTRTGSYTLCKVLGFREFLGRVEKDHIGRLESDPELFEKYLPYAMALAVEDKWTRRFGNIAVMRPAWYQGEDREGFLPLHLTDNLSQISDRVARMAEPE